MYSILDGFKRNKKLESCHSLHELFIRNRNTKWPSFLKSYKQECIPNIG